MVLHRIKDRLRKFNVAVAEVAYQDMWQRAGMAIVTVSGTAARVQQELDAVEDEIERIEPGLVTNSSIEFLV